MALHHFPEELLCQGNKGPMMYVDIDDFPEVKGMLGNGRHCQAVAGDDKGRWFAVPCLPWNKIDDAVKKSTLPSSLPNTAPDAKQSCVSPESRRIGRAARHMRLQADAMATENGIVLTQLMRGFSSGLWARITTKLFSS